MPAFFPILETILKGSFCYRQQLLFRYFFYLLNHSKTVCFHRCRQFSEEENVSGRQLEWIRWLRYDYGFVFGQKLTHKHRCVSWCVIMVQNPWLVFSQFCAFLTNCFAQSTHIFKVVLLINRTTLWQEYTLQSKKTMSKTFAFDELDVLFLVLALLGSSIRVIVLWLQCHSHTPMIRHQLWPFWANLDSHWTSLTFFCSKFSNFETIFATSVKIAWHEPNDMSTSSATSLIVFRQLSKSIFFTYSMFSLVVDVFGRPGRSSSLTDSRPSLNWLYHN